VERDNMTRVADWGGIGEGEIGSWYEGDGSDGLVTCRACGKSWGHDVGGAGPSCPNCNFSGRVSDDFVAKLAEANPYAGTGTDARPAGMPLARERLLRRYVCTYCGHVWAYKGEGRHLCRTCEAVLVNADGQCIGYNSTLEHNQAARIDELKAELEAAHGVPGRQIRFSFTPVPDSPDLMFADTTDENGQGIRVGRWEDGPEGFTDLVIDLPASGGGKLDPRPLPEGINVTGRMLTPEEVAEIDVRFSYHAPKDGQLDKYVVLRHEAGALARYVMTLCPESRERALALTKIEEAVMWANAAIARRE